MPTIPELIDTMILAHQGERDGGGLSAKADRCRQLGIANWTSLRLTDKRLNNSLGSCPADRNSNGTSYHCAHLDKITLNKKCCCCGKGWFELNFDGDDSGLVA